MIASSSRMLRSSSTTRTRVSDIASRQRQGERRPEPRRATNIDLTAVLLYDPVHERQPQPGPFRLCGEEGLEDVGDVRGGDPVAGVAHRHLEYRAPHGDRGAQLAAVGHGLD